MQKPSIWSRVAMVVFLSISTVVVVVIASLGFSEGEHSLGIFSLVASVFLFMDIWRYMRAIREIREAEASSDLACRLVDLEAYRRRQEDDARRMWSIH